VKQQAVASLQAEIARVRRRRAAIIQRGGALALKDRMLLEALARIGLEKDRECRVLGLEAGLLLDDYKQASARRDAAESLRDRKQADRDAALDRRTEEAAGDAAAWRAVQERERKEGAT
jgi:hypothetical protein